MSRGTVPTLHCDAAGCGEWDVDYWEQGADTVGGVRVTITQPAPGWFHGGGKDLCCFHALMRPPPWGVILGVG